MCLEITVLVYKNRKEILQVPHPKTQNFPNIGRLRTQQIYNGNLKTPIKTSLNQRNYPSIILSIPAQKNDDVI